MKPIHTRISKLFRAFFTVVLLLIAPVFFVYAQSGDVPPADGTSSSIPPETKVDPIPPPEPVQTSSSVTPELASTSSVLPLSGSTISTTHATITEQAASLPKPELPGSAVTEILPVSAETTTGEEGGSEFSYLLLTIGGIFALLLGVFAVWQSSKTKTKGTNCEAIKTLADQKKTALLTADAQFSLQESIIAELKAKITDSAKSKALQVSGLEGTAVHQAYETYEALKEKIEKTEKVLDAVKALQQKLKGEIDSLELQYKTCVAGLATPSLVSGFTLPLTGQKTILVDAMGAFVIEGKGIYQPLHTLLEQYSNKKIILTMAPDDLMEKWGLNKMPYEVFISRLNPKKTDPQYYHNMLKKFELKVSDVVYFEHVVEAVQAAQSLGIATYHYDENKKDLKNLKKFLDNNI